MGAAVSAAGGLGCQCRGAGGDDQGGQGDAEASDVRAETSDAALGGAHQAASASSSRAPRPPLVEAARAGDLQRARSLLEQRADANAADELGKTALHFGAAAGALDVVKLLIKKGARKDEADSRNRTPFLAAAEKGHVEIVKLLRKDVDVKVVDSRLRDAAKKSQVDIVKALLLCRAHVDSTSKDGRTALHNAAQIGDFWIAKLLLDSGASDSAESKDKCSPLTCAAQSGHIAVVQLLLDKGARLHTKDRKALGKSLISAVEAGDLQTSKILLMYEASMGEKSKAGLTPLMIAVEKGHYDIGRLFLEKGLCQQDIDSLGKKLISACEQGDAERAAELLSIGADTTSSDCFNETPLWKAAASGHVEVTKLLLEKGAYKEARSLNCSRTPVVIAADRGHLAAAKLLLSKGAALPDAATLGRKLREATEKGDVRRVICLLHCGASVEAVDASSETALHKAAFKGHLELVQLLVRNRANLASKAGAPGRTALSYAAEQNHPQVAEFLMNTCIAQHVADKSGFEKAQALLRS